MRTFQKILTLVLAAALTLPLAPAPPVEAQLAAESYNNPVGTNYALGAVSTDVGILIKYVGSNPQGGTVEVAAATGDITLRSGVVGGSTADLTTECPVSGALGGIIDVSDAACNTFGEVVDAINSSPNWRAVLVDALRSDTSNSTNGILITKAETSASVPTGVTLLKDTTEALNVTLAMAPFPLRSDIRLYLDSSNPPKFKKNIFVGTQPVLLRANGTFTGTGADFFDYIQVRQDAGTCPTALAATPASIICTASETLIGTYTEPGGTTGVNKAYDYSEIGLPGDYDTKGLVRLRAATTFTAALFSVGGFTSQYKK